MTYNQNRLWTMLPPGEWKKRDDMHKEYGKWNFQLSLSFLLNKKLIELQFFEGV